MPSPFLSFEEYLEVEEAATVKHEYVNGVLYTTTGGTISHNRATLSLVRALAPQAIDHGCEVFAIDARLAVDDDLVYYPDLMVCCAPEDTDDRFRRFPCLVAEVLSPGTQQRHRREKLHVYRGIDTVLAVLLVDVRAMRVEAASAHFVVVRVDSSPVRHRRRDHPTCPPTTLRVRDVVGI